MTGQDTVREMYLAGQRHWPMLRLEFASFARYCQRVVGAEGVGPLELGDLFLCCACGEDEPEAQRCFEALGASAAVAAIRRVDSDDDFVKETLQELWSKLLVGEDAKVRSYSGRGPLQAWVRVVATRVALDRARSKRRSTSRQVQLPEQLAADELNVDAVLLKARFGDAFEAALRASVAKLSEQERNVLRMHAVDQSSIDDIGRVYQVHRATAARWIERTREKIYADVREALHVEHRLTPSEFKSLATVLGRELEVSLGLAASPLSSAAGGGE
ncbi:MAG: sigma-70 family RNA polymerase sigma factor [Myxococcales bacterium]|nr:MAG: sigma-70 family RNA polymerase sigma factor [Myxococcales bacterium]